MVRVSLSLMWTIFFFTVISGRKFTYCYLYYYEGESLPANVVCKLHKSLYGLNSKFSNVLLTEGFKQSTIDHSLFMKQLGASFIALLVYVDHIVIASNSSKYVEDFKGFLNNHFKLNDLGESEIFFRAWSYWVHKGNFPKSKTLCFTVSIWCKISWL